ncbi:GFA family protein [Dongshaea marina]|uniref:GFA family protein n=1 Tax=Dongshaea marina TaxID=2047966 RepID=UPI000D3E30C0|nr:GFA family protein [Dongshaea marina]
MADKRFGKASCLCGSVTITANDISDKVTACHCDMCRKWSGGPALAIECGSEVTIDGEEHLSIYDSSAWAERGFCKACGTHLFYRIKQSNEYMIPAGFFQEKDGLAYYRDGDHRII